MIALAVRSLKNAERLTARPGIDLSSGASPVLRKVRREKTPEQSDTHAAHLAAHGSEAELGHEVSTSAGVIDSTRKASRPARWTT